MSKKMTEQQKEYNTLIRKKALLAAKRSTMEDRLLNISQEQDILARKLREMRNAPGFHGGEVLNATEIGYIRANQVIMAIKCYRERTVGVGLKEAKDVVDDFRRRHNL